MPEVNADRSARRRSHAIRVDFVWRDQRVLVETDGHETHRTRQAFEHDRRHDQRLIVAGWTVIRITWRQLEPTPGAR